MKASTMVEDDVSDVILKSSVDGACDGGVGGEEIDALNLGGTTNAAVSRTWVLTSLVGMCLCFSLSHGCVTSCVALASSDLGPDLGGYSSGTLYLVYTCTALFGSTTIVDITGIKRGLSTSLFIYSLYVASFIAAKYTDGELKWILAITGSLFGGFAAGFLWTAQGPFLTAATKLYALHTESKRTHDGAAGIALNEAAVVREDRMKKAASFLSAIFAFVYLLCEASMQVLSTVIPQEFSGGETTLFVFFTIVSVGCALGMEFLVPDLPGEYERIANDLSQQTVSDACETISQKVTAKAGAAVRLLLADPRMILIYPVQIGFGFSATFVTYYVNGVLIQHCVNTGGTNYVGYFVAIIALTASVASPILSCVTRSLGGNKIPVMMLGISAFLLEMVIYGAYNLHTDELVRGEEICAVAPLIGLYMLHGVGRGVWESTNKALIIDFFPNDPEAAFANVIVSSGGASTVGFFAYEIQKDLKNNPLPMTTLAGAVCLCGLVTLPIAAAIHHRSRKSRGGGGGA